MSYSWQYRVRHAEDRAGVEYVVTVNEISDDYGVLFVPYGSPWTSDEVYFKLNDLVKELVDKWKKPRYTNAILLEGGNI